MRKTKVVICEDHVLFREGVKSYLNAREDMECIWEVQNGAQLLHRLQHAPHYDFPDVVLLDINMPVMTGLEALPMLKENYPNLKIVMLTMHNELSMVSTAMSLGANSYVAKNDAADQIVHAINSVQSSGFYFNDMVNQALYEDMKKKRMKTELQSKQKTEPEIEQVSEQKKETTPSELKKKIVTGALWGLSLGIIASILYFVIKIVSQNTEPLQNISF